MVGNMLEVIVPIFGIVALGYGLTKKRIFDQPTGHGLTQFMFYIAVPAMLFDAISVAELPAQIPWAFLCAFYLPSFLIFAAAMLLVGVIFKWQRHQQGIAGVCASYSNMVLLGLPLLLSAYGDRAILPLFLLLAPQSMLLFPTTIFAIEVYGGRHTAGRTLGVDVAKKILFNPIILSLVIGIGVNLSGLVLTPTVTKVLDIIGAAAPGCALTALGISLAQYTLKNIQLESVCLAVLKVFVHPALVFATCMLFGVKSEWAAVAVFLAAMPCGINAFIFASSYEIKTQTITHSIVLSTLMSVFSSAILLNLFQARI